MTEREKVIRGLERLKDNEGCMNAYDDYCKTCPYVSEPGCCNAIITDALALLKAQAKTINDLYGMYDGLCKEIREKYESDDVCGLCQYDGAYVGESGDWMNECPGFETNDCCRLNLEKECREGEYEAYAPKDDQGGTCGNDFCEI